MKPAVTKTQRMMFELGAAFCLAASAVLKLLLLPSSSRFLGGTTDQRAFAAVIGVIFVGFAILRLRSAKRADDRLRNETSLDATRGDADSLLALAARYEAIGADLRRSATRTRDRDEKAVLLASAEECELRSGAVGEVVEASASERTDAVIGLIDLLESYPARFRAALEHHGARRGAVRETLRMLENPAHPHWSDLELARSLQADGAPTSLREMRVAA